MLRKKLFCLEAAAPLIERRKRVLNLEAKALAAKATANGEYGGSNHIQNLYTYMLEIAHDTLMEYWNIYFSDIKSTGSVLNVLLLIIHHPRLEEVFINV